MDTLRALVVDDNDANRLVIELMLEAAGFETIGAASGAEALAKVHNHRFDLILTDLRMPGIDGLGLLAALRAMPATRNIPVIGASAALISPRPEAYLEYGFDAFLAKPMLVADVHACVAGLGLTPALAAAA